MKNRYLLGLVSSLALTLIFPMTAWATDGPAVFREGTHIVRPGDTLEKITARYLGTSDRWKDNWRLNESFLNDPHSLQPGQRLRVLLEELPANGALVSMVSNKVEDRLLPLKWKDAEPNDLLQPNDNLRTLAASSASLLFPDDTMLVITELSLVIIGDTSKGGPEGVDKMLIEIDEGQADFGRAEGASGPVNHGIEIQIGEASMVPKVGADGKLEARARNAGAAGAQVMIYSGESAVSAGGQSVNVPQGMGSAVKSGQAPSPPEKLLPSATGLVPESASEWAHRRPEFRWQPVSGAVSYTVEVCQDPRCASLLARDTGLTTTSWTPSSDLPFAGLYWRVTATSASGLDGYPSGATNFHVVDKPADTEAPTMTYRFEDPKANINEQVVVGPGFSLEIETEDRLSGIESWHPVIDGAKKTAADLAGPWSTGEHQVVVVAVDKAGNEMTSEPIEFIFDDVPPQLVWGMQTVDNPIGRDLVENFSELDGPSASQRGRQTLSVAGRRWWMDSDFTQVILRPTSGSIRLDGAPQKINKKQGLWILAEDEICQIIDTVRYDLEERQFGRRKGTAVVIVEAIDCVGNRSRIALPLKRRR